MLIDKECNLTEIDKKILAKIIESANSKSERGFLLMTEISGKWSKEAIRTVVPIEVSWGGVGGVPQ